MGGIAEQQSELKTEQRRPSGKSLSHFHQQEVDTSLQRPRSPLWFTHPRPPGPAPQLVRGGRKGGRGPLLVEPLYLLRSWDPGVTVAWVSHTRTKETGQYLTPEEAWSSSQVPQDEPHGQWVWEAGLGLGTRTRPQPHGGSKKGQEQRRRRLSSQGPTPPAPAACPARRASRGRPSGRARGGARLRMWTGTSA